MTGRPAGRCEGSRNRRVLMVFEPLEGGVPAHVLELAARLRPYGWEAEVAGPAGSPWLARLSDAGLSVYGLPFERPAGTGALRAARALRALDRSRGYTIVHAQSSMAGPLCALRYPMSSPWFGNARSTKKITRRGSARARASSGS